MPHRTPSEAEPELTGDGLRLLRTLQQNTAATKDLSDTIEDLRDELRQALGKIAGGNLLGTILKNTVGRRRGG
jgi:hypothetical protein